MAAAGGSIPCACLDVWPLCQDGAAQGSSKLLLLGIIALQHIQAESLRSHGSRSRCGHHGLTQHA